VLSWCLCVSLCRVFGGGIRKLREVSYQQVTIQMNSVMGQVLTRWIGEGKTSEI
jgi:hypothetical protein